MRMGGRRCFARRRRGSGNLRMGSERIRSSCSSSAPHRPPATPRPSLPLLPRARPLQPGPPARVARAAPVSGGRAGASRGVDRARPGQGFQEGGQLLARALEIVGRRIRGERVIERGRATRGAANSSTRLKGGPPLERDRRPVPGGSGTVSGGVAPAGGHPPAVCRDRPAVVAGRVARVGGWDEGDAEKGGARGRVDERGGS